MKTVSLNQLKLVNMLLFMRKILKNEVPTSITDQFHILENEQYNLRSNLTRLKLAKPRANALKRSFNYYGANWNNLPTELKSLSISDRIFKNKLQDFIRKNISFYNNFTSCQ